LFYKHLRSVSVRSGQYVAAGTKLGELGTGVNGGPHLHLGANPVGILDSIRYGRSIASGDQPDEPSRNRPGRGESTPPRPQLSDRQKFAQILGLASGRRGLVGKKKRLNPTLAPLVNAALSNTPDYSGSATGANLSPSQTRAVSRIGRKARAAARADGKSPEDVRAAGEEAERKAEVRVLKKNRVRLIQARAKIRKAMVRLHNSWKKLTRKPAKTPNQRRARKAAQAQIAKKLRELRVERDDFTEMIAEVDEVLAELHEQAIADQHAANYEAGQGGDAPAEEDQDLPTEEDRLNLAAVEALFTETPDDDLAAARALEGYYERQVAAARAGGDPRVIAAALQNLLAIRQQIAALTKNTEAITENTEALRGFSGSVTFGYRGQDYVLGSLAPPSSDRLVNLGVGV
jgi:chromosome segregation ATPase